MTPLVDDADTDLALVALLAQAPYEVAAVRAESWLPQESSHEFVGIDLKDDNEQHSWRIRDQILFLLRNQTL